MDRSTGHIWVNHFRKSLALEQSFEIIRIFNGCEVLIESSVTTVIVRHHEACRFYFVNCI